MLSLYCISIFVVLSLRLSDAENTREGVVKIQSEKSDFNITLSKNCATVYTSTCFKLDIVSWLDKLDEKDELSVLPGILIVKNNEKNKSVKSVDLVAKLAREFPSDPDARLDTYLMKKLTEYLKNHSVKLNLWDTTGAKDEGRGKGGGGGGKKGGGGVGYLIAAGAMMKGAMLAAAMSGIALIAGKALMTGVISIVLSTMIGLKSLGQTKTTTYEIVAKPVYSSGHTISYEDGGHYGHSGYGRSIDVPLPLARETHRKYVINQI